MAVGNPTRSQLQVDHVTFIEVDDLISHPASAIASLARFSPDRRPRQRRACACTDDPMRLVAAEHGDGIGALQAVWRRPAPAVNRSPS